ncbi:MAG: LamB/YcsF family protein [Betaproteobacteria bacterium]|nr:LamB/YcsF family protein [Betaproteobacteria bacterium]
MRQAEHGQTTAGKAVVDLNADMGESFGAWTMGNDAALMPLISSANIACGFHAGDPSTVRATVNLAAAQGVAIGAHPGLPDLQGFGRRTMSITPDEAYELVLYQAGALSAFAQAAGSQLHHVKAHGALYNMAAKDRALSKAMAHAVKDLGRGVKMYVLAGSLMEEEARLAGLQVRCEVFADRRYMPDGTLTPRSRPDALISDESESVAHVLRMVNQGHLIAVDGSKVPVSADTLCIHGDKATDPKTPIKSRLASEKVLKHRAPGRNRTCDPWLRRLIRMLRATLFVALIQ